MAAFLLDNLVSIGFGPGGCKKWIYKTDDLTTEIDDSGYFNAATTYLSKGDLIDGSCDNDGTPLPVNLIVTSATGAATVTTSAAANITYTLNQRDNTLVEMDVVGTAQTKYFSVPRAGTLTKIQGVTNANGLGSGGTSTVTVSVPTTGAVATVAFTQSVVAGTNVASSAIAAHTLAADAVITVTTDGTGSHTGNAYLTIEITPS